MDISYFYLTIKQDKSQEKSNKKIMWYKFAIQGSLWSRVSPTFHEDLSNAIDNSIVKKTFTKEDADNNEGLRKGIFDIVDFNLLEQNIKKTTDNEKINKLKFIYKKIQGANGQADYRSNRIYINTEIMQDVAAVKSMLIHEIGHIVDFINPHSRSMKDYYWPDDTSVKYHIKTEDLDLDPEERTKEREKILNKFISQETAQIIQELITLKYNIKDIPKIIKNIKIEAKKRAKKRLKALDKRAQSLVGGSLYMSDPRELRSFKLEFDNYFSFNNLLNTYKMWYSPEENGKQEFLQELNKVIQLLFSKDEENYDAWSKTGFIDNHENTNKLGFFRYRIQAQLVWNRDEDFRKQCAKYLTNIYLKLKEYLK